MVLGMRFRGRRGRGFKGVHDSQAALSFPVATDVSDLAMLLEGFMLVEGFVLGTDPQTTVTLSMATNTSTFTSAEGLGAVEEEIYGLIVLLVAHLDRRTDMLEMQRRKEKSDTRNRPWFECWIGKGYVEALEEDGGVDENDKEEAEAETQTQTAVLQEKAAAEQQRQRQRQLSEWTASNINVLDLEWQSEA